MIVYRQLKYRMFPTREQLELFKHIVMEYNYCVKRFVGEVKSHVLKVGNSNLSNDQLEFLRELIDNVDIYKEQSWLRKENKIYHEAAKDFVISRLSQFKARYACFKFNTLDNESLIGTSIKLSRFDNIAKLPVCNDSVFIPEIGSVRFKKHIEIPLGARVNSIAVSVLKNKKFYFTVWYSYTIKDTKQPDSKPEITIQEVSDDYFKGAGYPMFFHRNRSLIRFRKRKISKLQNNQKESNKSVRSLAKLLTSLSNKRLDYIHKITKNLTDNYSKITIEPVNASSRSAFRNRVGTRNFVSMTKDLKRELFHGILSYKCQAKGVELVMNRRDEENG